MKNVSILLVLALSILLASCSGESSSPDDGFDPTTPHAIDGLSPDGKQDNYISVTGREYELRGTVTFELPAGLEELDEETRQSRLDRAAQERLDVVRRAIQRHVESTLREANGGSLGKEDRFWVYFRSNAGEVEEIRVEREHGEVDFFIEMVGNQHLMSAVAPGSSSVRRFEVEIGGFSGAETVEVRINGSPSRDSFPRYNELFEDGVFDIAIHFGGDYNSGRHDLETVEWTVEYLLERGWSHPTVRSYEELEFDSGPFVREMFLEGRPLEVHVYLYHAEMAAPPHQELMADAMRESFAERDVVIYSGHAGSGAGFILDYSPRFDIPAREFANLPMADKYQIYVLDGCMTYRTYVDDILANPAKNFDNVDIVTTVNTTPFGLGYQVIHQVLFWLTITDQAGNHYPLSWQTILRGLNSDVFPGVHYGAHGVDNNPRLNPHGHEGVACSPCFSDADCGAGGNLCLNYSGGAACGVACTTDEACGNGYRCARLFDIDDYFYIPKQCVPNNLSCR